MSERYFITEEVLFDMAMPERERHATAERLLDLAGSGEITLCLCTVSIDKVFFVLCKYMGEQNARALLKATLEALDTYELNEAICIRALALDDTRFDDACIMICAEQVKADGIIVHDPSRFLRADIKVIPIDTLR